MKKQRFHVYLTNEQIEQLKELKNQDGLAITDHVRQAINEYLLHIAERKKLIQERRQAYSTDAD